MMAAHYARAFSLIYFVTFSSTPTYTHTIRKLFAYFAPNHAWKPPPPPFFLCKIEFCESTLSFLSHTLFYADENGNSDFHTRVLITHIHTHAVFVRREKGVNCSFLKECNVEKIYTFLMESVVVEIDCATWKVFE